MISKSKSFVWWWFCPVNIRLTSDCDIGFNYIEWSLFWSVFYLPNDKCDIIPMALIRDIQILPHHANYNGDVR